MNGPEKINSNYVSDILDEIALEGLDGITIDAFWKRLSVRRGFGIKIDENSKKFIWRIVIHMKDVRFYEIPKARPFLKHYDFTITSCSEQALMELNEVFPYCSVKNVPGILGSCPYYFTRIEVTTNVVQMDLNNVEKIWGNKLVMVASQESRNFSLMGELCPPDIDLSKTPIHYDMLERIGRSRRFGATKSGKGSLQTIVEDSKSIFHYLKFLHYNKLIKKQPFVGNFVGNSHSSKVFLTRFYEEEGNEHLTILQIAIEILKRRPDQLMPSDEFYALFDPKRKARIKKFKKSSAFKRHIILTKNMPYRTFFPNASQLEWERKSKGERMVRCFKLINADLEYGDMDKDCDVDDEESSVGLIPRGVYYKNIPMMAQAYHHVKESGTLGLTCTDLSNKMGVNKRYARALISRLCCDKYCKFYIETDGRRRTRRYIVGEDVNIKAAASVIAQILSENSPKSEVKEEDQKKMKTVDMSMFEKINLYQLQDENVSYRALRRIGFIIKTIKAHRFRLFSQISKYVNEEEVKEGLTSKVDRVTIQKILQKLEKDGLIKSITLTGSDNSTGPIKLYADLTFEPDEKLAETIYNSQLTFGNTKDSVKPEEGEFNMENEFSSVLIENMMEMKKMFSGIVRGKDGIVEEESRESELVYSPKFMRLNILHDFIFHLVYNYSGILDKPQEEMLEELSKTTVFDDELKEEMPRLYDTHLSQYMFVPPLKTPATLPGWFLISDVLTRMPLSIISKVLRVGEINSVLAKYLHHPIRKHFLVKDLPLAVRQGIFDRKSVLGSFYNDLRRLCFIGLIQYGPKFGRDYYQGSLYLNRKASLLDTRTSPPDYNQVPADMEFELKTYYFSTEEEVKGYWNDMYNISMGTNLGVKALGIGKDMLPEREMCKESLKRLIEPKTRERVLEDDDGRIPGDNLGAAGLDSVLFSFLRCNWTGPISKCDSGRDKKPVKMPLHKLKKGEAVRGGFIKRIRRRKPIPRWEWIEQEQKKQREKKSKGEDSTGKKRRKTIYDEADLEALRLMNTLRATWSTAEDNLLLICRVAMMYLCPNARMFMRIPWVEVRKVLQKNLPEARDKTQKAVARRATYMLKNPTTIRSVNLCLEELREIPEVKVRFDCSELHKNLKPSAPNLTELQNQLYEKFNELVNFLKDRFLDSSTLTVTKSDGDLIPDSLEEFMEKFQVDGAPKDPLNVRSIRENVIRAVLISSLSCRSDKTSSAVQLFDIYRQYEDRELQNAIKKLHSDRVITISKKAGNPMFKSGQIVPLTFNPYKLSYSFKHLLTTKYPHSIYSESFAQIDKFLQMEKSKNIEVDLNDCNVALYLLASKDLVNFKTVLPEQIIALDSGDLSDSTYSKMLQRYCQILRLNSANSKVICSSGKIISKTEDGETVDVSGGRKRKLSDQENDDGKKERLEDIDDEEDEEQEKERMEEDEEESKKQEPSEEESGKKTSTEKGTPKITRSSRVILYIMREEAKRDAFQEASKSNQDVCVVNASSVNCSVDKEGLELYAKEMEPKVASIIIKNILNRSSVPFKLVDEESLLKEFKEERDKKTAKDVLKFISSKRESGATVTELKENFEIEALHRVLGTLTESKIVIKSGMDETRYIFQNFYTPWLLNSFKMTRLEREKVKPNELTGVALTDTQEDKGASLKMKGVITSEDLKSSDYSPPPCSTDANNKIKVIIRPWLRIDGSLNRKVLDRFLGVVLSHIMSNPGISLRSIMDKFSPSVTPVWTKDLVEILMEIGCVSLTTVIVSEKVSLFSNSVVELSSSYTGLEDDKYVIVEAKVDAITNLGLFIGKKTYSRDFLMD